MPRYLILLSILFFILAFFVGYRGYFVARRKRGVRPYADPCVFVCLALVGAVVGFLFSFYCYGVFGFLAWGIFEGGHYPNTVPHRILAVFGHLAWAFFTAGVSLLFTLFDSHKAKKREPEPFK